MQKDITGNDVEGSCPLCHHKVAVYAKGGKLRIRAHKRNWNTGTGWREVTCPVTGLDGAGAIATITTHKADTVEYADAAVAKAETALAAARERAAEARTSRDAYAARVAALTACAQKGGTR